MCLTGAMRRPSVGVLRRAKGVVMGENVRRLFRGALCLFLLLVVPIIHVGAQAGPIIVDHTSTDLGQIPQAWIDQARSQFRLAYGHTSHGSQIVSGMTLLEQASSLYRFNRNGAGGALSLHDYTPEGDLGNPNRTAWYHRTRQLLDAPGNDRNLIMWSWCGQVGWASASDIADDYLALMSQLERDYPDVTFVYMTGHLAGTGLEGNLHQRNEQIRDYCRVNDKVLFDFADIERYDPDGRDFMPLYVDDGCYYDGGNWAEEWCAANPGECATCDCAHSHCLNCQQKGRAFWWMMARLAGWSGAVQGPTATPTATGAVTPTATAMATGTSTTPPTVATATPTATLGDRRQVMVLQQGAQPDAGYAGAADVILANDVTANANLGGLEHLECFYGEAEHRRTLLRWDLSPLPKGCYVQSAVVELYRYDGEAELPMPVALYTCAADWVEGTGYAFWPSDAYVPDGATWTNAAPGTPWDTPGGDYGDMLAETVLPTSLTSGWVRWDATAAVKAWVEQGLPNHGLLLRGTAGQYTYHYFHSKEAENSALRPKLTVTYWRTWPERRLHIPLILKG